MSQEPIIAVYAQNVDRNYLLGYAIGAVEDIKAYYDDKKAYGLVLEPVNFKRIPKGYAADRKALVQKRDNLQKQLDELDKEIKLK